MKKIARMKLDRSISVADFLKVAFVVNGPRYRGVWSEGVSASLAAAGLEKTVANAAKCALAGAAARGEEAHEIFFSDEGHVLVLELVAPGREITIDEDGRIVRRPRKPRLEAALIYDSEHDTEAPLPEFCNTVSEAIEEVVERPKTRKRLPTWSSVVPQSPQFAQRKFAQRVGGAHFEPPSSHERSLARELEDVQSRSFLRDLKKVGIARVDELTKPAEGGEDAALQERIGHLKKVGLVDEEFAVVCRSKNSPVIRVSSQEEIQLMDQRGVRCQCGRPLSEEVVAELISVSEPGQKLLDHSRWMTIRVVEELLALGLSSRELLVSYSERGDEMDIFLNLLGSLVLLELKDGAFELGHSYSFSTKFMKYHAVQGVIVTSEYVSSDARETLDEIGGGRRFLFARAREPRIEFRPMLYIEGLDSLGPGLEAMVQGAWTRMIYYAVRGLESVGGLRMERILLERLGL